MRKGKTVPVGNKASSTTGSRTGKEPERSQNGHQNKKGDGLSQCSRPKTVKQSERPPKGSQGILKKRPGHPEKRGEEVKKVVLEERY